MFPFQKVLGVLIIIGTLLFMPRPGQAQAPQGINYQAVARDGNGDLLADSAITVRIGIRSGSAVGPLEWEEDHAVTTNAYGLFSLVIGSGTSTGGGTLSAFKDVSWESDSFYLSVQVDDGGGGGFVSMGTSQFVSVPYALHSEKADTALAMAGGASDTDWTAAPGVVHNDADVGIGTSSPAGKLHVQEDKDGTLDSVLVFDNGRLGIGTVPSSATELHLHSELPSFRIQSSRTNTLAQSRIEFGRTNGFGSFVELGYIANTGSGDHLDVHATNNLYLRTNLQDRVTIRQNGRVGVGTTNPLSLFHVDRGSVLFSDSVGTTPVSGGGIRFMWVPKKRAIRAGEAFSNEWDAANVGKWSAAFGDNTKAAGDRSMAWGYSAWATGPVSTTWGTLTEATHENATSWGEEAKAYALDATAWGYRSRADANMATAWGDEAVAAGQRATAWGNLTQASGDAATAWGYTTGASGNGATAWGQQTSASSDLATAWGTQTQANNFYATAWGRETRADGFNSTAWGHQNIASGSYSTSIGWGIDAAGSQSIAIALNDQTGTTLTQANTMAIMGGPVGIGTVTPGYALDVNGGINGANVYCTSTNICSDQRFKQDIRLIDEPLQKVLALEGIYHHWRTDSFPDRNFREDQELGVIAQDVQKILPEVVRTMEDGYLSVDYARLTPLLIEAIKAQQQQIIGLEERLKTLKAEKAEEQEALEAQVEDMEKELGDIKVMLKAR